MAPAPPGGRRRRPSRVRAGTAPTAFCRNFSSAKSASSLVMTAPPRTSLWPLMNFVVEWTTMSAPRVSGDCRTGVANVLSTTVVIPLPRTMAAQRAISVTCSSGLDGVSSQSSFVVGRRAASMLAGDVVSTNVNSMPKRENTFVKMRQAPP